MLPIYRKIDGGYKNVKQNFSTFEACFDILSQNKTLMILAEGATIQEKRLRPIRKGPARIALGALEKCDNMDLKIVPVGVNYTYADKFRSHVMFEFGEPISVQKYMPGFQEHPDRAVRLLTNELEKQLKRHLVIIENREDEELTEKFFVLSRNNFLEPVFPIVSRDNRRLKAEKNIAKTISTMSAGDKSTLEKKVYEYFEALDRNKLDDWAVAQQKNAKSPMILTIVLGFIPAVLGYAGNYLPVFIANLIASKYVKYLEFMASVRIAVAVGAFLIYYFILFVIFFSTGNFMLLLLIFFIANFWILFIDLF